MTQDGGGTINLIEFHIKFVFIKVRMIIKRRELESHLAIIRLFIDILHMSIIPKDKNELINTFMKLSSDERS
jgi:hypothetical protein